MVCNNQVTRLLYHLHLKILKPDWSLRICNAAVSLPSRNLTSHGMIISRAPKSPTRKSQPSSHSPTSHRLKDTKPCKRVTLRATYSFNNMRGFNINTAVLMSIDISADTLFPKRCLMKNGKAGIWNVDC